MSLCILVCDNSPVFSENGDADFSWFYGQFGCEVRKDISKGECIV